MSITGHHVTRQTCGTSFNQAIQRIAKRSGNSLGHEQILQATGRLMLDVPQSQTVEWKIIQSYILVLRAPRDVDGQKTCPLARHGVYEVRLIEPSEMPQEDAFPFWIELFDHKRKTTLDSFGTDDLEEAAIAALALFSEAEMLHRHLDAAVVVAQQPSPRSASEF
jgi:hypothetical protein